MVSNMDVETSLPPALPPIPTRTEIGALCLTWRTKGEKIAFTSGVFDLIHIGHIRLLQAIKSNTGANRLVVALNSDESVRSLKGSSRPILPATERASIIQALKGVDAVFIFHETNNKENVLALKPDVYVKASDYNTATLSSAPYLKAWNGKPHTIGMEAGYSTTNLIDTILLKSLQTGLLPQSLEHYPHYDMNGNSRKPQPAIFLDRDGVLIADTEYLHREEQVQVLPGVLAGLKVLLELGYVLIVVTNQPGIGMGYFSREDFFRVNKQMLRLFSVAGITLSGVYFCPHSQSVGCTCRKPEGGMVTRATSEHLLDLANSFFIGDQTSDIETAKRLKLSAILMATGKGGKDGKYEVTPDFKANDLLAAAQWIKEHQTSPQER